MTAKTYVKQLQEQIELLEDGFDIKSVEIDLLKSEMEETLSPYKLLGEQTGYLLDMLTEVIEFERKKPSERITASKTRLITLLHINTQLSKIVDYNQSLKLINRNMVASMQLLRIKNFNLTKEVNKLTLSNQF